jgi:hypothetical protein
MLHTLCVWKKEAASAAARSKSELAATVYACARGAYDYLDDPEAPSANSLVPSVNVAVTDVEPRVGCAP